MQKQDMKEQVKSQFDIKVHHRDDKGNLEMITPYTCRVTEQADGTRMQTFEQPPGSGNIFDAQGRPAGRRTKGPEGKYVWDKTQEHIFVPPPETTDQKYARELTEKNARIAELEKEIAARKLEDEKKFSAAKQKVQGS